MNSPNESQGSPDFSFLGEDAPLDAPDTADFAFSAPPEDAVERASDESSAADIAPVEVDAPPNIDINVEPEARPDAVQDVEVPAKKAVRRLKPKKKNAASAPVLNDGSAPSPVERPSVDTHPARQHTEDSSAKADDSGDAAVQPSGEPDEFVGGHNDVTATRKSNLLTIYAIALTLLFLILAATGRLILTGPHPLESLPDITPLKPNEFQQVPDGASLPHGHTLSIGQTQRFGDVEFRAVRVTQEPLRFADFVSGLEEKEKTTRPVLKLWFRLKNVSKDVAFPPWDTGLMSHRHPAEGTDDATSANSWLRVGRSGEEVRVLNYLHPRSSHFDVIDQGSRVMIQPGEETTGFIASSEQIVHAKDAEEYRWRLQIRKGVNRISGNGVTTLLDVTFGPDDIDVSGPPPGLLRFW